MMLCGVAGDDGLAGWICRQREELCLMLLVQGKQIPVFEGFGVYGHCYCAWEDCLRGVS
jgi:hypothetical protein